MTPQPHPIMEALAARPAWTPAPLTRLMQTIRPAVAAVTAEIGPVEATWRDISRQSLAAAGGEPAPRLWVVLGDSTAQGIGASSVDHGWVARLDAALTAAGRPHAIVNLSRSGAHSHQVIDEQLPLLAHLPYPASLVTVCCGANDLMRNPNPATLARRMRRLAAELPMGSIVSTLPSPRFSPTGRWVNRAIHDAASANDLLVAELGPHLVSPRRGTAPDLYHPNDLGYGAWVRAFAAPLGLDADAVPDRGTVIARRAEPT